MNSGSFFQLDLDTSKVVDGITYYDYIDVPDLDAEVDELQYPIRLTISSEEISFFVHYYKGSQNYKPHHIEDVILRLPYKSEKEDSLSSYIKRLYNTDFPLSDYLEDLLRKRYKEGDNKYEFIQNSPINKDSYSSLFIWGLLKNNKYDIFDASFKITKFLRKLLLDFMFDLLHSDVFMSNKYYSQMLDGLMKDFFFASIVKKSEYYYNRRLVKERLNIKPSFEKTNIGVVAKDFRKSTSQLLNKNNKLTELKQKYPWEYETIKDYSFERLSNVEEEWKSAPKKLLKCRSKLLKRKTKYIEAINNETELKKNYTTEYETLKSIKNLYAERLYESENEWTKVIMSPMAEKHFVFSPDWFEDQEKAEMHEGEFYVSESWFVNPEEEMSRVLFPLPEHISEESIFRRILRWMQLRLPNHNNIHYMNSFELSQFIGSRDDASVQNRKTLISKWYYGRFDFHDTFRIHLFDNWIWAFTVVLFILVMATIFRPGLILDHPRHLLRWISLVISVGLFTTAFGFHRAIKKISKNYSNRIDVILIQNRRKRELRKTINYAMIFLFIWAIIKFYPSSSSGYLFGMVLSVVCFIIFLWGKNSHIINNIHLLLPRMVASITTAWITLVIGNELVKETLSPPICGIITIIVFVFILYESNKTLPSITIKKRLFRAFELMLISYSISLVIGIFAINVISLSFITDDCCDIIQNIQEPIKWTFFVGNKDWSLMIFPNYLISFSFLAMFIGVFIQMIFEEKNITKM